MKCPSCYTPSESFDKECLETGGIRKGEWRNDGSFRSLIAQRGNRCRTDGKVVREKFRHYFNTSGQVPWQNKFIFEFHFLIYICKFIYNLYKNTLSMTYQSGLCFPWHNCISQYFS